MRQNVRLRKFTGSAEAIPQLVEKSEIDIDLFVARAVERSCSRFGCSAAGVRYVTKEHQLGVPVGVSRLGQQLLPCLLGIIENEGDKLDFFALSGPISNCG